MRERNVVLLGSLTILALLLAFGCALLPREDTGTGEGWFIKLQIKAPAGSKGITVTEFDVTGLKIQVWDPEGELLQTIDWAVAQGTKSYLVSVHQLGKYAIEVTHIGEREGQPVQATETAPFTLRAMKITVIDIVPGCIGVIDVEGGEPPVPTDLTGYWDVLLTPTGGLTRPPHLMYLKQTGSELNGSGGLTGTIEGSTVTFVVGDDTLSATIAPDGSFGGPYELWGETGTCVWRRSELTFGTFALSGLIDLETDRGLGSKREDEIEYRMDFHVQAGTLQGSLGFWNMTGLAPGTYEVVSAYDSDPGPNQVGARFFETWDTENTGTSGTLTLTRYDATGASGFFAVEFEGGNSLTGSFELNPPMYNGVVAISGGYWNGAPVTAATASGQIWSAGPEMNWGGCDIDYIDENLNVGLNLNSWSGPITTGTFSVPDQYWVEAYQRYDDGSGFAAQAVSGTLVITSFVEGVGIKGHFENMVFPSGTLSGSFDVSFELNDYQ
jgi:hypothetical protein